MLHRPFPKTPTRLPDDTTAGRWVATEKLHGAHLVVATDGTRVQFGKRKAWLEPDEPFFGWQLLRAQLEVGVREVSRLLQAPVRVHGELIGGAYPHPAVAAVPGLTAIQTGCWYEPGLRFVAFDVIDESSEPTFLSHTELTDVLGRCGLDCVPLLARNSRQQLEALPVEFLTQLPAKNGLPLINDNFAEGYVLKPDARWPVHLRPSVKRKHPHFDDARFDESAAWTPASVLPLDAWLALARRLVNPARIASARSKVGVNQHAIREEVLLDVLVDLEQFQPQAFRALGADVDFVTDALHRYFEEPASLISVDADVPEKP